MANVAVIYININIIIITMYMQEDQGVTLKRFFVKRKKKNKKKKNTYIGIKGVEEGARAEVLEVTVELLFPNLRAALKTDRFINKYVKK